MRVAVRCLLRKKDGAAHWRYWRHGRLQGDAHPLLREFTHPLNPFEVFTCFHSSAIPFRSVCGEEFDSLPPEVLDGEDRVVIEPHDIFLSRPYLDPEDHSLQILMLDRTFIRDSIGEGHTEGMIGFHLFILLENQGIGGEGSGCGNLQVEFPH